MAVMGIYRVCHGLRRKDLRADSARPGAALRPLFWGFRPPTPGNLASDLR